MEYIPATGALASAFDIRTFSAPAKAFAVQKGGTRYTPEQIQHQRKVGICTAISLTQNAHASTGIKFSADFQYLIQKKFYDEGTVIGWNEGSSIFHALKAAKGIGLLPEEHFTQWITEADRNLPYAQYIAKLKAIPETEIAKLILIANKYKIKAYASVKVDRDSMAEAIYNSKAGVLTRYTLGNEWWTDVNGNVTWDKTKLEPLRPAAQWLSGHAVTDSNFDGNSFRIANTWSKDWADNGTAYRLHNQTAPTEAWQLWYWDEELPKPIEEQVESRSSIIGKIMNLLQQVIALLAKLA